MKNNRGFIELKSVSDYWEKLLFDHQVLKENPGLNQPMLIYSICQK